MKQYRKNVNYFSSSHLVFKCSYHVIICPKYRHKILIGKVSDRLKEIILSIAKTHDFVIEQVETDRDHIHMIISCNPRYGIMKCISSIKSISAYVLFKEFPILKKKYFWCGHLWSRSSFVATTGSVSLEVVKEYIKNQGK